VNAAVRLAIIVIAEELYNHLHDHELSIGAFDAFHVEALPSERVRAAIEVLRAAIDAEQENES
jgi:hypothetical protein